VQRGFAKSHHKITPKEKVGVAMGQGSFPKFWSSPLIFLQRLKLAISSLVCGLGFSRPVIKLHPDEKVGVGLG